jgi:hypothetical protein
MALTMPTGFCNGPETRASCCLHDPMLQATKAQKLSQLRLTAHSSCTPRMVRRSTTKAPACSKSSHFRRLYLWGFFQGGKMVWENYADERKLPGAECSIQPGNICAPFSTFGRLVNNLTNPFCVKSQQSRGEANDFWMVSLE